MRGRWEIERRHNSAAFEAVFAFLEGRMEEHRTLDWAIRLGPQEALKRAVIDSLMDGAKGRSIRQPWKGAWDLLLESWALATSQSGHAFSLHAVALRLKGGDRSGDLIQAIIQTVTPRFSVHAAFDLKGKPVNRGRTMKPRRTEDLVRCSLDGLDPEDPGILQLDHVFDASFLESLAQGLDATVNLGVDLIRRIGCYSMLLGRVYYVGGEPDGSGRDDPDDFHRGLASAVKVLHAVVRRLAQVDMRAASDILARWRSSRAEIHLRLWAALARDYRVVSGDEVARFLMEAEADWFWNLNHFPEMAELRSVRFEHMGTAAQRSILARLKKGPPRNLWSIKGDPVESQALRSLLKLREWLRLELAGNTLPREMKTALTAEIKLHPNLEAMRRMDEGFPEGAKAISYSPKADARFDYLTGKSRLEALESAFAAPPSRWLAPNESEGANAWLVQPENLSKVLGDLEGQVNGLEAFTRLLGYFWRLHTPAQKKHDNIHLEGERVLAILAKAPDGVMEKGIKDLAGWLDFWKSEIASCQDMTKIWLRIWPFAVAATNDEPAPDESDETLLLPKGGAQSPCDGVNLEIHSTAAGQLAVVFLKLCPSLTEIPRPFAHPGDLARLRSVIWDANGRAGLIVRSLFLAKLDYFLRADQPWAMAHLIPLLFQGGAHERRYWHAFMGTTQFSEVIQVLGEAMAERAVDQSIGRHSRNSILFSLVVEGLYAVRDGRPSALPMERIQQILRFTDDEGRAYAAGVLLRFAKEAPPVNEGNCNSTINIRSGLLPFLVACWPQERSFVTSRISQAFARIPALAGEDFVETVEGLSRFLLPFECWSLLDFGLHGEFEGTLRLTMIDTSAKAKALLFLLDHCVGQEEGAVTPVDLSVALESGPRPNFLDHQEGVINGRQSETRQGDAGGEPLRSSRRQGAAHAMLLLKGPAALVENA